MLNIYFCFICPCTVYIEGSDKNAWRQTGHHNVWNTQKVINAYLCTLIFKLSEGTPL